MSNLEKNPHKAPKDIKSTAHIMNNAYKIAESSEIYMALDKKKLDSP